MKIIFIFGLTIYSFQLYSQSDFGLRVGLTGAFAKMGNSAENSFIRTNLIPGFSLSFTANNIFGISKIEQELNYSRDGHKYRVYDFFEEKSIDVKYIRNNIGLVTFYRLNKISISDKKKPNLAFLLKPGIWGDYIVSSSLKYNDDPIIRDKLTSKYINFGAVISFELIRHKPKKGYAFNLYLRYYYGIMNLSKNLSAKWFTRKFELGSYTPLPF